MPVTEPAPAKVNLALHVTGRRADGYHLLDSLVVFADCGDELMLEPHTDGLVLEIDGPFATGLEVEHNLVLKAARMIAPPGAGALIRLTKRLPVAAGLGGGSADAAAMLRLGARYWQRALPDLINQLRLGADVPVCLAGKPAQMRGIGEELGEVPQLPPLHMVLINPGLALSTAEVFAHLPSPNNAPMQPLPDAHGFIPWLEQQRNDLQAAALSLCPAIGDCLAALVHHGAMLARMSGSGASCFGLFESVERAAHAAAAIGFEAPGWWVQPADALPG